MIFDITADITTDISDKGAISSVNLLKNDIPVEQAQELVKIMQSKEKLTTLCGLSGNESTLDFSNQGLGPADAVLIANDISDMGALSVLNLASNDLGELVLPEGWSNGSGKHDEHGYGWYAHTSGADQKEHPGKPEGIIALANAIPNMGALSVLSLKSNSLGVDGGKALADGLKGHTVITELNIAENPLTDWDGDMSGVIVLADAIKDMGALAELTFGDQQVVTMTTEMTEANFSGKLKSHEAQIVAAFLPKCT
jgi:hypothetical protein